MFDWFRFSHILMPYKVAQANIWVCSAFSEGRSREETASVKLRWTVARKPRWPVAHKPRWTVARTPSLISLMFSVDVKYHFTYLFCSVFADSGTNP